MHYSNNGNESIFRHTRHGEDIAVNVRLIRRREDITHVRRPSPASIYVFLPDWTVPASPVRLPGSSPTCCTFRLRPTLDPIRRPRSRCLLANVPYPYLGHKNLGRCPPDRWRYLGNRVMKARTSPATCRVLRDAFRRQDRLDGPH